MDMPINEPDREPFKRLNRDGSASRNKQEELDRKQYERDLARLADDGCPLFGSD